MSILNRLNGRHLDDAALAAIWIRTAAGSEEASAARDAGDPHLAGCAECHVRFDAFASWMDEIRDDARLEADQALPAERLAAQHAIILRRIEASERPARVIAFPKYPVSGAVRSTPVQRWIAAAAAAGLIVGVGLGQLMDFRRPGSDSRPFPANRVVQQSRADTTARAVPASASVSEETLLLELEAAATPHYEALRAYDTLTPRAADFLRSSR